MDPRPDLLRATAGLAARFLEGVGDRPVHPNVSADELRAAFGTGLPDGGGLPEAGEDAATVIQALASAAEPGIVASAGPRYFGFVIGGSLPAALAADWLTSAWDQNAGLFVAGPAAAIAEDVAGAWLLELLGLPAGAGVGFTTGATMANLTALAAARSAVLDRAGWDVESRGLVGAPSIRIVVGDEAHATIPYALRLLGLGSDTAIRIPVDGQGRMREDALRDELARDRGTPTIVCAQAGNVNTGAFDPLREIADAARDAEAWLHVDGAFGLWAAASPRLRPLVAGVELADSWTTDTHKWLNVPYDSGVAIVAEPRWQARAMALSAAYLLAADRDRDGYDWVPEASRRARGFAVYAALRSLGRGGVAELVERCCELAARFATGLAGEPGIRILNDVVLNQVLVRFEAASTDGADPDAADPDAVAAADERTRAVIAAIQRDGTLWAGGTVWHGRAAMRISVSNWSTTAADVDRSVEAIIRCARGVGAGASPAGTASRTG